MDTGFNTLNSQNSSTYQAINGGSVASAIKMASAQTGVDFSYLMNKANVESSMDPAAKSTSSTATGLYQFVEQTWLHVVKVYGEKYGLSQVADRISVGSDGVARVADKSTRQAILNLRKDPKVSSQMAAELTNENRDSLQEKVGGKIGSTELYLAHFLGASGAATFLKQMHNNPQTKAADVLPTAASANASIFYDKSGAPRSLGQIYQHFAKKFEGNDMPYTHSSIQVASATPSNATNNLSSLLSGLGLGNNSGTTKSPYAASAANGLSSDNSYVNAMVLAQMNMSEAGTATAPLDVLFGNTSNSSRKKDGTSGFLGLVA